MTLNYIKLNSKITN